MDQRAPTVLAVDDDADGLRTIEAMLRRGGYQTMAASGPLQALEKARDFQSEIHLLLTDVVMPEMDGVALAQQLVVELRNLRVLLISECTDVPQRLPLLR